ncbi:MAG: ATP-binding protein [Deltaproteobacteria bacterium]|nr:ATP-binding protein [Deltaproteobacteria bacterium]
MPNPFRFGKLTRRLKETVRIFLVAPRRYGKTSLIKKVLEDLRKEGMATAYLDLYWANSSREFLELWGSRVMRGSRSIARKAARFMKDFLPRLRPKLGFDSDGDPEISVDISEHLLEQAVEELFDLPEKIARAEKRHFVVVLDEFQEILRLDGEALERQMRAAIQNHTKVSYLFAGSKTHMLGDMVSDQRRPFYQIGTVMTIDKIPEEEFRAFVRAKFSKSGKEISSEALVYMFEVAQNVPHYVQLLSFNLWDHYQNTSRLEKKHVEEALTITLRSQEPAFLALWEGLTSHQRKTLQAVSALKGRLVTAKETILRFGLESASNVARSLKGLCSKGILRKEPEGYVFDDVLFGRWVERCAGLS